MTVPVDLPKYVTPRLLASGKTGFYWVPPQRDKVRARSAGTAFPFQTVALGADLSSDELAQAAAPINKALKEWRDERGTIGRPGETPSASFGTVEWLIQAYLQSRDFTENVSPRTAPVYRNVFKQICDLPTKSAAAPRVGELPTRSITPRAADKIYDAMREGGKLRRGEMAIKQMRRAWDVVGRHHPDLMPEKVPNPWRGVTLQRRAATPKQAVTRDVVYLFAEEALRQGKPEAAAAAVVCFEWLQRPENMVLHFTWANYDPPNHRGWVNVEHHKTGVEGWHPLVDPETGERLYPEAEAILAQVPRRALLVCVSADGKPYAAPAFAKLIARVRAKAIKEGGEEMEALTGFTLDACRHGGMTELEEAGLTEGEGMALSAHKQAKVYHNYAKRTQARALGASRKRRAFRLVTAAAV